MHRLQRRPPVVQFISVGQIISGHVRRQHVVCYAVVIIVCSVSQGSVLQGPRLFILYTADLADVAARHTTLTFIHTQMTLSYISAVSTRGHDDGYPTT